MCVRVCEWVCGQTVHSITSSTPEPGWYMYRKRGTLQEAMCISTQYNVHYLLSNNGMHVIGWPSFEVQGGGWVGVGGTIAITK